MLAKASRPSTWLTENDKENKNNKNNNSESEKKCLAACAKNYLLPVAMADPLNTILALTWLRQYNPSHPLGLLFFKKWSGIIFGWFTRLRTTWQWLKVRIMQYICASF